MLEKLLFILPFYVVIAWVFYIIIRTEIGYYRERQERKIAESQEDRKAATYDPDDLPEVDATSEVHRDLNRSKAFQL